MMRNKQPLDESAKDQRFAERLAYCAVSKLQVVSLTGLNSIRVDNHIATFSQRRANGVAHLIEAKKQPPF